MNKAVERMAEIEADRGLAVLMALVFLLLILSGAIAFYKNWKDQKAWERKRADRKDKLEEENLKAGRETNKFLAGVLAKNTSTMNDLETKIINHQEYSSDILQKFDVKLDNIDDKVKVIGHTQDRLATKEMVEDVSQDIKEMRKEIRTSKN